MMPLRLLSLRSAFLLSVICTALCPEFVKAQTLTAKDTAQVRFLNGRKFFVYEVKKGETLYSISRKFEIPTEELTEINPELKNGLKPRQEVWVPAFSWKNLPRTAEPETAAKSDGLTKETRNYVHLAVFSDLSLPKVYTGETEPADSTTEERFDKSVRNNMEFTEGAVIALERFHRSNPSVRIRITIVDTEGDSVHLAKSAARTEFKKADVWITNETGPVLSYLNRLSQKEDALLISCGVNTSEKLEGNRSAVSLLPSSLLQCRQMGAWAAGNFKNACAVFVKTANTKETERMNAMKSGWMSVPSAGPVRVADYTKGFGKAVVDSLRSSKHNVVFVSSSNEDMITGLLLALKDKKATIDFSVVGLPTWYGFETVDPRLMQACDVYYFNSGSIDLRPDHAVEFRQTFRDEYNTEPGETAYIGYDAAKMIIEHRKRSGADLFRKEVPSQYEGLYSDYRFRRMEKDGSSENQHITVWSFKELIPGQVDTVR